MRNPDKVKIILFHQCPMKWGTHWTALWVPSNFYNRWIWTRKKRKLLKEQQLQDHFYWVKLIIFWMQERSLQINLRFLSWKFKWEKNFEKLFKQIFQTSTTKEIVWNLKFSPKSLNDFMLILSNSIKFWWISLAILINSLNRDKLL